jgi:hypothetical protein
MDHGGSMSNEQQSMCRIAHNPVGSSQFHWCNVATRKRIPDLRCSGTKVDLKVETKVVRLPVS